ncbi:GLIPR1-like protein 1 [Oscarella lobularis]|uniref:GLIPR1-like protein 1 n=1 Tax=Oscarella lobularis TaxID=121494 RepID=UPI00331385B0
MRGCLLAAILPTIALAILTQEDRDSLLEVYNKARAEVSPPAANMHAMVWDSDLELVAQNWANRCRIKHSPGLLYGENLMMFPSDYGPISRAAELWREEELFFTYDLTDRACQDGKYAATTSR